MRPPDSVIPLHTESLFLCSPGLVLSKNILAVLLLARQPVS